jgi:hypothetical protein
MSVASVTEISAVSERGFEDAITTSTFMTTSSASSLWRRLGDAQHHDVPATTS